MVRFELAGVGSRAAAFLVDLLVVFGIAALFTIAAGVVLGEVASAWARPWVFAGYLLLNAFVVLGYFWLFEAFWGGRTPGKRLAGIRVVMDTGRPITLAAAFVRNAVRLVDMLFPLCPALPAVLTAFLSPTHKRPGDYAAGTIVVRDRPTAWRPAAPGVRAAEPEASAGEPLLSEDEFRLLDRYLARAADLLPAVRDRFSAELVGRFAARIPPRDADPLAYLADVLDAERARRRGRFGVRAAAAGPGRVTVTAERFVERKRDAWEAFRAQAERVEGSGVAALPAAEVPAFAAHYREVAADLARARTYGVPDDLVLYLERLVAAGHNALYRGRGRTGLPVGRLLLREFPAAVVRSWRWVVAAALLFLVPGAVGYAVVRDRPAVADEIAPPVMVSRAQEAADREARGVGYAQAPNEELPVIAAAIIENNVLVCLFAFAGGLLCGVLTLWSLVFNGLELGVGFGVFANYHAAAYLGTFVAGHGVLELTAIFISGGAGFRLASALVAPGDRTRRDALVLEGAVAARMIGAVVTLLAIAGTIEGLLSASDAPAAVKFAVSGLSVVFLALYFTNGARARSAPPGAAV